MKQEHIADLSEGLQIILTKMFDIVNAPHDLHLVDDWYNKYEWDAEQEEEFNEFFLDFIKNHPKRKDIVSSLCRSKKDREQVLAWFNMMFGWKRKDK